MRQSSKMTIMTAPELQLSSAGYGETMAVSAGLDNPELSAGGFQGYDKLRQTPRKMSR
jgi:hypothetical protein